jgi:hypothetical protein
VEASPSYLWTDGAVANGAARNNDVMVPHVDIAGLLSTGLTLDTASTVAAYSRVTSVNAQMSGSGHTLGLVASQVASTCNSGTDTASANLTSR